MSRTLGHLLCVVVASLALAAPSPALAQPVVILFERNTPSVSGLDLFVVSFPSMADVVNGNATSSQLSNYAIDARFNVAGLTNDASGFHMLVEQNTPSISGRDLFVVSFASLADLIAGNDTSSQLSNYALDPRFNVAGLTNDASGFHMLVEQNTPSISGRDLFVVSFASLADLLAGNDTSSQLSDYALDPRFDAAGLTNDGAGYHMLVEQNTPSISGRDLFVVNFGSLAALLGGNDTSSQLSDFAVHPDFNAAGINSYRGPANAGRGVPEPTTLALVALSLVVLGARRARPREPGHTRTAGPA